ncbi:restriction endonuclease [Ruegeria sp. HKCCA5426]|uniref:restriction endonuclease n=1 Tax=Ruegeria sp. HKCCA5426 TaxID=2682985 RepID=UPI00352FF036
MDAVYEGGAAPNTSSDAIAALNLGVGNSGGFRQNGGLGHENLVVLYTSGEDKDWPDSLDPSTGRFVYFGDNKKPGNQLHDTPRKGNQILRRVFQSIHASPNERRSVPPFLVFAKYPTAASSRSVRFRGLAVPGFPGLPATTDLVAIWKTTSGARFQNYQSVFTILDVPVVRRDWLNDLVQGNETSVFAPKAWVDWVQNGKYTPLTSEATTTIRSISEQTPEKGVKSDILRCVFQHFKEEPTAFETFAARIFQMHDQRAIIDEITRGAVDGGRDAVGRYLLGLTSDPVYAEFSLEAKCYRPGIDGQSTNTVGVKEVSRLISRIRHREFGILVTTSAIGKQAYEEVREDGHPIIFFSGRDIAEILTQAGYSTPSLVKDLLSNEFPVG